MATNTIKMVIQFRRDTTANWEQYKHIVPAAGEPCFDIELGTLKIGDGVKNYGELEAIGGHGSVAVAADGKSIVLEDGIFKLAGFNAAEVGAQPRKNADGNIEWVVPSTETVEGLQTTVAGLQSDVSTLLDKIDGTGDGSVDAKIDAKINEFANDISDDGNINTLKELVDYVASHGTEAADMAAHITTLQDLVGDTKVSDQINSAVAGLVKAEVDKGLSTNDFTDTLLEKLDAIEAGAQVNKIESVMVGNTVLDIVEKSVVIPIGAGLKASDEITVAEDGTLGIGQVSFSKIVQAEGETVIMDGGSAAG